MVRSKAYSLIISLILAIVGLSQAKDTPFTSSDRFPLPQELEVQVEFWIDVYTKYHTNEYIIHDTRNLSIVYEVVQLGRLHKDQIDLPQTKKERKFLKKKSKQYRSILLKLGSSKTNLKKLTSKELEIFKYFGESTNRRVYRTAAKNIRVQRGQKDRFERGLKQSGKYIDLIKRIFRKHGLPEELSVLPHVESSFNYLAYSSAGAAGMWQITRRTGRRYLKINYEIDERLDPLLSTEAAAKLLKNKYNTLGEWPIAITAYNHGLPGMKRAKRKLNTTDIVKIIAKYRSRYFGFASRNFYCEFLAALHVVENYQEYFSEIAFEPPEKFQEFELPYFVKLSTIENYFNISVQKIREFNPALRKPIFNDSKYLPKKYMLRLPINIDPALLFASVPESQLFVDQKLSKYYRVRRGDTLSKIASRHRTSTAALMAMNNIASANRIRTGVVLRIPQKEQLVSLTKEKSTKIENKKTQEKVIAAAPVPKEIKSIEMSQSEKVSGIPKSAGPKVEPQAIDYSTVNSRKSITPEILFITNTNPVEGVVIVEPDETLGHYADWLKIPTQHIRNLNDLTYGEDIQFGTEIRIVFQKVKPEDFINSRLEYHRGIEEDFFLNYNVLGTTTHQIKRGDNIWYLCNYVYKLPFWLIKSYNSEIDFQKLKPGDLILIPEIQAIESTSANSEINKILTPKPQVLSSNF
ncbi:transglycosylase SLT domain-containing protein [candidate division KSB1 bacterium]|nr:transglycosylase SLT domain-containing protein [candidate division KSB1 bacterium]